MRTLFKLTLGTLLLAVVVVVGPRAYTFVRYQPGIHSLDTAPSGQAAIVFGAGLTRRGTVTRVLYDRVATAADLLHAGKVDWLLLSGDNRAADYNEPAAMRQAALELGVPEDALVLDAAGISTYDTCYRAHAVYGLEQALLVTQDFHLPRALFLCDVLGLDPTGVSADRRFYRERVLAFWNIREVFATAAALWDVAVARPAPAIDEPITSMPTSGWAD
jgi:SanA protein